MYKQTRASKYTRARTQNENIQTRSASFTVELHTHVRGNQNQQVLVCGAAGVLFLCTNTHAHRTVIHSFYARERVYGVTRAFVCGRTMLYIARQSRWRRRKHCVKKTGKKAISYIELIGCVASNSSSSSISL